MIGRTQSEQSNTALQVFSEALERSPAERAAFLDDTCSGNASLRAEVEGLLRHHKQDDFLESAAFAIDSPEEEGGDRDETVRSAEIGERPGNHVGRYKLLQQIGEGGIGVVFMAEQEAPVRRRVALKVLKPGMDTKSVIARFESERQALALMDHPNIAKILDAGATESGRPYFVMDLVRGVSITEFCDQNRLTTRERLTLFTDVCQAIQHAHQKGVIHRDIKPTNILVTLHDGVAVPKVIDFGIAKAIDQRLTDNTCFTEFQSFIGTPAYVSPEQAEMSGLDVDTRADIYSLGVLLYEMLTGKTPFDGRELWSSGLDNMRRTIREEEPVSPSDRLRTMLETDRTTTADRQRTDSAKLTVLLRGDLDWIVLKALEKDRTRRYATASALALDVGRYLNNEPVLARPPSAAYRFRKLVRRNRLLFAGVGAFASALVIGLGISTWQFIEKSSAYRRTVIAEAEQSRLRGEAEAARRTAEGQTLVAQRQAYAADMNLAQNALKSDNLGRARELLSSHSQVAKLSDDLRGWEWRYLWEKCRSDALYTLGQFSAEVSALSVSHDDKWIAVGEFRDTRLAVWDLRARTEIAQFPDAGCFAFSPTAPLLAFYTEERLRLWNVESGQIMHELPAPGCRAIAFSTDGLKLMGVSGKVEFTTWEVSTGAEIARIAVKSPRGRFAPKGYGDQIVLSNDLSLAAQVIERGDIRVLDLEAGTELWRAQAAEESVTQLAFSPDGRMLASAAGFVESAVRLWDVATGSEIGRLNGHRTFVRSLAFSPNGKTLASGSADQTIKLWDVGGVQPGHSQTEPLTTLRGHRLEVWSLAFCPDGSTLVSGCKDGSVCVWDTVRAQRNHSLVTLPTEVLSWQFLPDSQSILALDIDGWLARFEGVDYQQRRPLIDLGQEVRFTVFSDDGHYIATAARSGKITVWDIREGKPVCELATDGSREHPITFLPGSHQLVTSGGGGFRQWDVPTGKEQWQWKHDGQSPTWRPVVSPDGKRFAGFNRQGSIWLGSLLESESHGGNIDVSQPSSAAFSPDGAMLAVTSVLGHCELWDVKESSKLATLQGFLQGTHSATFSPDGRRLAVGSNGNEAVKLWDVASRRELLTLSGQGSMFDSIGFSPDGNVLAARNSQRVLHIWRAPSSDDIDRQAEQP